MPNTSKIKTIYIGWNIDSTSLKTLSKQINSEDLLINLSNKSDAELIISKRFEIINISSSNTEHAIKEITKHLDIIKYDRWEPLNVESISQEESNEARLIFREISEVTNAMIMQRNTLLTRTVIFVKNFFKNVGYIQNNLNLKDFHKKLENRPFVIVAAGPSLDKQLDTLKEYQKYFYIVAVDKAFPSLKKHDITPDFVITIDPLSIPSWGLDELNGQTIFVNDIGSSNEIVKSNNKNRLFISSSRELTEIAKYFGIESDLLESGGSVATSAFSLAYICGGNPIILLGQDLAFTGNRDHAADYINAYSEDLIKNKINTGFTTEGYYGDQVQTDKQLLMYKYWFENKFGLIKDRFIFNCTEGGALVKNSINIPFKTICIEISSTMHPKTPILKFTIDSNENQYVIDDIKSKVDNLLLSLDELKNEFEVLSNKIKQRTTITAKLEKEIELTYESLRNLDNPVKILIGNFNQIDFYSTNKSLARAIKKTKSGLLDHHISFIESTIKALSLTAQFLEEVTAQ
jgi:hypothetical protein